MPVSVIPQSDGRGEEGVMFFSSLRTTRCHGGNIHFESLQEPDFPERPLPTEAIIYLILGIIQRVGDTADAGAGMLRMWSDICQHGLDDRTEKALQ